VDIQSQRHGELGEHHEGRISLNFFDLPDVRPIDVGLQGEIPVSKYSVEGDERDAMA